MAFYEKGDVRIAYEEAGKGFPLLIIAGGGLNSTIEWARKSAPFRHAGRLRSSRSIGSAAARVGAQARYSSLNPLSQRLM